MTDCGQVRERVRELAARTWNVPTIEARYRALLIDGIPRPVLDLKMLKGLSPFPGFGVTGSVCGAVSGGLFVLGLYFGSDDLTNYGANGAAITAARAFIPRFEAQLGSILCPRIQEDHIFGRSLDVRASPENLATFKRELGYAKCALPAGIGARLAAEIIIERMQAQP